MARKEISKKSAASKKTTDRASSKAAPKTSVKTRASVQSHAVDASTKSNSSAPQQKMKFRRSYILFAAGIILLGALLYLGRGLFVAAVVNGQPISRIEIIKEAEKQSGRQALDTIVRNTLIEQEARKANVTVSNQEIDDEIKKVDDTLSKQGQKLDDVLAMQGMTKEDLRRLIRLDKLVGKIVGKDVKVTDQEVNDYLTKNKDLLPEGQSEEELKKAASEQIKQQKLNDKIRTWLESLQTKAKIMYFVQY
jgi:foldase protein PrsA